MVDPAQALEIVDGGYAVYPARAVWGPRMLAEFEFVWIIEGQVQWICDDITHLVGPGDIVLVRPGMRDQFRWDRRRNTRHAYFLFTIRDSSGLPPEDQWPLVRSMTPDDMIRPLFRFVLAEPPVVPADWGTRRADAARMILWAFVHDMFALSGLGTSSLHPTVDQVLQHLHDAWATPPLEKVGLAQLATVASVSESHLCRVFTRTLGHSPIAIVRYMRVYWGAMALAWSDLSVGQIAAEAGFPDLYHFSRRFRDVYGIPPSAFRHGYARGEAFVDSLPPGASSAAARVWGGRDVPFRRVLDW